MNTYTKLEQFLQTPQQIMLESKIIDLNNTCVIDNILYEKLDNDGVTPNYRFFFSSDDYDYLENEEMIARLDTYWMIYGRNV